MEGRQYDVVILGASGFTGLFVMEELCMHGADIKWCVAGRNTEKVKGALKSVGEITGKDLSSVEVIKADVDDHASLVAMCEKAKLVINCVGPYRFFGKQVVQACVDSKTHHIDVCGEPQFLEEMQLKYFNEAKEKEIYIIGACGFDSIPCDLGLEVFKDKFDGDLNAVESFISAQEEHGITGNFATWQSAIHGIAHASELKAIRLKLKEELFTKKYPKNKFILAKRSVLFKDKDVKRWCVPFVGSDQSICSRTQMFNYEYRNQRPVQIKTYSVMPALYIAFVTLMVGAIFFLLAKYSVGRYLLEQYPEFFSCGTFSKTPKRSKALEGTSTLIFRGNGWKEKLSDLSDVHTDKPDKKLRAILKAPAPYVATAICVINAARVVLTDADKIPMSGGVFTPGAAFRDTSLMKKLEARGFQFTLLD